jgi:hypothetical protein
MTMADMLNATGGNITWVDEPLWMSYYDSGSCLVARCADPHHVWPCVAPSGLRGLCCGCVCV